MADNSIENAKKYIIKNIELIRVIDLTTNEVIIEFNHCKANCEIEGEENE